MEKLPTSLAKLTRPTNSRIVLRKRLFEMLDHGRKNPVIWVSGPPGCGKTTLVSSYLETRDIRHLWYQLDEGDGDPATYFHYLKIAGEQASPGRDEPLQALTPEYLPGIAIFAKRFFERLCARLQSPSVIVFDNHQDVPADSPLDEVMLSGFSEIPEGTNVVVISREGPPPCMARLLANQKMEVLGWDDLKLTLEESCEIAHVHKPKEYANLAIERLHDAVGGWAAGMVLMLQRGKKEGIENYLLSEHTYEKIFDYFAREVLEGADKRTYEFLLKTSLFPHIKIEMAHELTGLSNVDHVLSDLSHRNYFMQRRFLPRETFQYHQLFRNFLLACAEKAFSPEEFSDLRRKAAALLVEDGQIEAAVVLYKDIGDWDALISLIMKHAKSLVQQGRYKLLGELLECIPEESSKDDPWLQFWMGECRLPFEPLESHKCFERAFKLFRVQPDSMGTFLAWSRAVDSVNYGFENLELLDFWIEEFNELMREEFFPSGRLGTRVASSMAVALVLRKSAHPDIEQWAELALVDTEDETDVGCKLSTLAHISFYQFMYKGDFRKASFAINSLRQLIHPQDSGPLALVTAKKFEAIYLQWTGSHEECMNTISDGLEISRKSGVHAIDHSLLVEGAMGGLNVGDYSKAEEFLEQLSLTENSLKPLDMCGYHLARTRQALIRKDLTSASFHAKITFKVASEMEFPLLTAFANIMKAHVAHELGNRREAAKHLARVKDWARQMKSRMIEFHAFFSEAEFALSEKGERNGLNPLRKALTLGREIGSFASMLDQPASTARLCVQALENGIEVDYVQSLIRNRRLVPTTPPLHLENWPWPVRIYTLGRFELLVNEEPIQTSRKTPSKVLSLLKVLVALGGRKVRETQLEDALWPDAEGDMAHQAFANALHRLRKLIGHNEAVQRLDGCLTLDPRYCWVDVWAFERHVAQAEGHWVKYKKHKKKEVLSEAILVAQKASSLYGGAFLPNEPWEPWAVNLREQLRNAFLGNVRKLGAHWEGVGQWDMAIECYYKGLEADTLAEELYQRIMICHDRLGRRAEALSAYEQCKQILSTILGIDPSAKTDAIRKSLLDK